MNEQWPEWVVSYEFEGSKWGLSIFAPDAKEAVRRLRAIGMTGTVDGQLMERVPAVPGAGLYVRLKTAFKNLGRSR
jgi:hypothetical protein